MAGFKIFGLRINILPDAIKKWYLKTIQPIINFMISLELNPNFLTTIGFVLTVVAGFCFATGHLRVAGIIVLLAGTFDIVDGKVARASNRVTKFGALYDSTLDRYAEVILFFGMAFYFIKEEWFLTSVTVAFALGGSLMVSYVRARAEALGFVCKVGIMQRPERIVYIGVGALIHLYTLIVALYVIAVLANITAMQRLYHIWRAEDGKKSEKMTEAELERVGD